MKARIGFVAPGREPDRLPVASSYLGEVTGTYTDSGDWSWDANEA